MSISRIRQIKRILKEQDVRDPRGTVAAIAQVVATVPPKNGNSKVAVIEVRNEPSGTGPLKTEVTIGFSKSRLEPRHLIAVTLAIKDAGDKLFSGDGECNDPACPVHGSTTLNELFKQFEADAIKVAGIKKGAL